MALISPARTAPSEKLVAVASRLTAKLVTSRSGLLVPVKLGRMSPAASTIEAARSGEPAIRASRATVNDIVFIELPLLWDAPRAALVVRRSMPVQRDARLNGLVTVGN